MHWVRMHPYAAACALAGFLLLIGALIVERRTDVAPSGLSVWGGNGAPLINPSAYTPSEIANGITETPSGSTIAPTYIPPGSGGGTTVPSGESISIEQLLAAIIEPPQGTTQRPDTSSEGSAFSFSLIPSGFIFGDNAAPVRSSEQQILFEYGNAAALHIQAYENAHASAPITMREQAEDRENAQKRQAIKLIGDALRRVGEELEAMNNVPEEAASVHASLATSYIEAGEALALVPYAEADEAFIAAIEGYNSAADQVVRNYVRLAEVFLLAEVSFSNDDPGNIFMFPGNATL